jgi:N-acetylneuraminic acid mutarotase
MPTPRQQVSVAVVDGIIYALGGNGGAGNGGAAVSTVEAYDPTADKWTQKANMLTPRSFLSAVVVDGKIYAIGGWAGPGILLTVEMYDPTADKWTQKADMQTPREIAGTYVYNGKIYVTGGLTGEPDNLLVTSAAEVYDPMTDTWTEAPDLPTPRLGHSSTIVNGKVYVIGGSVQFPGHGLSNVDIYDPTTGVWTTGANLPDRRDAHVAGMVDGKIYVIGGFRGFVGRVGLSVVEAYDPGVGVPSSVNSAGKLTTTWGEVKAKN